MSVFDGAPRVIVPDKGVALTITPTDTGEVTLVYATPLEIKMGIVDNKIVGPKQLADSGAYFRQYVEKINTTINIDQLTTRGIYSYNDGTNDSALFVTGGEGETTTTGQIMIDAEGNLKSRFTTGTDFTGVEWNSIAGDSSNLLVRVETLEGNVTSIQTNISTINDSIAGLDADVSSLQSEVSGYSARITAVEQALADLDIDPGEIDQIKTTLETLGNALDSIEVGAGNYLNNADTVNANTLYTDSVKYYITNDTSTNFPIDVPLFIDVVKDNNNSIVFQKVTSNDGGEEYVRTGVITPGNAMFGEWIKTQKEDYDINKLKDEVLAPVRLENANTNIDNAIHINGYYYVRNTSITGLPVPKFGIAQVLSDTSSDRTFQHFISQDFELFYRSSTSTVTLTPGINFYRATATSGENSVEESLVVSAQANGTITFRPQLGTGINFSVNESITSGIAFSARVEFNIDNEDYKTNGFTITFSDDSGGIPDTMELTVNTDGTITPVTDSLTLSNSYIRYQSGSMDLSATGTKAEIYLTVTWTNYTGNLVWTNWISPYKSKAINEIIDANTVTTNLYLEPLVHTNLPTEAYDGVNVSGWLNVDVVTLSDNSVKIRQEFTSDNNILFLRNGTTASGTTTWSEWESVTSLTVEG